MRKTFKNKNEVVRKGQHKNESVRKGQKNGRDCGEDRMVQTAMHKTNNRMVEGGIINEGFDHCTMKKALGYKKVDDRMVKDLLPSYDQASSSSGTRTSSLSPVNDHIKVERKVFDFVKQKIHCRYNYLDFNCLLYPIRSGQNRDDVDNITSISPILIDKVDLKTMCVTSSYRESVVDMGGDISHLSAQIRETLFSSVAKISKRREDIASSVVDIDINEQAQQFRHGLRARCTSELLAANAIEQSKNLLSCWKDLRSKCEDGELIYFVNPLLVTKFKQVLAHEYLNLRGVKYHLSKLGPFPVIFTKEIAQIEGFTYDEMLWIAFIFENSCALSVRGTPVTDIFRVAFSRALCDNMPFVEDVLSKIRGHRIEHFLALVQYSCEPVLTCMVRPDGEPTLLAESDTAQIPPMSGEGAVGVQAHSEMNTAIESTIEDQVADFVEVGPTGELANEFEDYPNQPEVLTSRFVEFFNFNLTTAAQRGQILAAIQLPDRLLAANDKAPNALMFKQYEWYRAGIDLKIQTNCSKLQQFAVFAAVIYGANDRDSVSDLLNLNTLSTMPCMVINGSFSTSMEMHVPFVHAQNMIPIGQNSQMRNINYATLVLAVASPLIVAIGTPATVNIRLFGALKGAKYYGQRGFYQPYTPIPCAPVSNAQGDMLKAAAAKILINNVAQPIVNELTSKVSSFVSDSEKIVLQAMQNINRDKPIEMRRTLMIQTSGQDMAAGLGKCLATPMRLNPFGTTPHPISEVGVDQKFSIDAIKQIFGLVGTFNWPSTASIGTRLFSTTVQLGPPTMTGNILNTKNMSPVDHLAAMFATYRGSLKYKFMFVTNGIATGRVRVCYEPGVTRTSNCDVDTIPFAIFDLGADLSSNTVFEFVVPYQYMQHQYLLKPTLEPVESSGFIHSGVLSVFVEIPLVAAAIVPANIDILVYKAGDSNIEFGVPRNMLTAFAAPIEDDPQPPPPPPDDPIEPGPPPIPPPNFIVSRVGVETIQSTRTSPFNLAQLLFLDQNTSNLRPAGQTLEFKLTPSQNWTTVSGSIISTPTNPLFFWFTSVSANTYFFTCAVGQKIVERFQRNIGNRVRFEVDGISTSVVPTWEIEVSNFENDELPIPLYGGFDTIYRTEPVGHVRPDGDPRLDDAPKIERPCPSGSQIMPVANGEKQDNLYDNLRRMEKWMEYEVLVGKERIADAYHIKIPANFGAPCYRRQTDIWMRTNKITAIADMFRFARGGLRMTFVVSSNTPGALSSTIMEVVHIPFAPPEFGRENQVGTFSLQSMGYSVQAFSLQQNNINTIEIPHYNLGSLNYNSSFLSSVANVQRMNSLGTVFVRFTGPEQTIKLEVFRALADDTRFYVFNGTPDRSLLGSTVGIPYYEGGVRPNTAPPASTFVKDLTTEGIEPNPGPILSKVRPDGLFQRFVGKKRLDKVDSIIESVDTSLPKMQEALEKVNNIFDDVSHAGTYLKIADITTQVLHVINSPKFSTFILSLTSIICKVHPSIIGHGVTQITGDALGLAKGIWQSTIGKVRPDGFTDEIWQFVCALGGTKFDTPKGIGQRIAATLRCATMSERIVALFKTIFVTLRAYAIRMLRVINPDWLLSKTVLSEDLDAACMDFLEAAPIVCSPDNFLVIRSDAELAKKVLWLQQTGIMLEGVMLRCDVKHKYAVPVKTWNNKLMTLVKEIIQNANAPFTRYEPFVLYITSSPGMGKSFESDKIIQSLLRNLDVKVTSNAIYSRAPASEYWDGYHENTLVVKYDDFAMTKDERGMLELTELIHLKTSATYIGNFSEIHEKQKNIDPMIVVCCSNLANPQHSDINDLNAVWRRRDVLVQFKLSSDFKKCSDCLSRTHLSLCLGMTCVKCRDLNSELISDERHLRVTELDPLTGNSRGQGIALGEWKRRLVITHKEYHRRELENVADRLRKLTDITLETQHNEAPGFTPIKGDEKAMTDTLDRLRRKFDNLNTVITCENSHAIVKEYWVNAKGLPSEPPPWHRFSQGSRDILATMRLKSTRAFNDLESLCLRIFNLSKSYDVTKIEDQLVEGVLKDLESADDAGPSVRPDGLGGYMALTAASSLACYAIGASIPHLMKKRYKCSHNLSEQQLSEVYMENGFAVSSGKKFLLECDECYVSNAFRCRTAVDDFFPCVCTMPVPKDVIRMGSYLWADNFVYTSMCNSCNKADTCRYTCGKVMRDRYNLHQLKDIRDKNTAERNKKELIWHTVFCSLGIVIGLISTYSHFKMYARGDNISDDNIRPDSFTEKEFSRPKRQNARSRMIRGDAGAFDILPFVEKHCAYLAFNTGIVRILRIGGSKAITTQHQAQIILKHDNIELTLHDGTKIPLKTTDINFKPVVYDNGKVCDIAILTFPKRVPEASSLAPHFVEDTKLDDRSTSVTLFKPFTNNKIVANVKVNDHNANFTYLENVALQGLSYSAKLFGSDDSYYLGACGTLAIDNVCGKIVGMHVASETFGYDKLGFIQFITKEFILDQLQDEVIPMIDVDGTTCLQDVFLESEDTIKLDYNQTINTKIKDTILTPLKNVSVIGSLPVPLYQIAYSSIKKSPMCGVLSEPNKRPVNFLNEGEPFPGSFAMKTAIEKNDPCVMFSGKHYNKAKEEIKDYLVAKLEPATIVHSIRTADEAINGNENVPHFIPIDMSTSPGYPDKVKHTQKKTLFCELQGRKVMCHDLENRHSKNMLMRFVGVKPTTIYACSLKDERLPDGKAPRLIQGAPVEFIIASRRLTMDFASCFYTNRLKAFSAVGMNCVGEDWQDLHKQLKWKNNIMAGDIKSFGPTLDQSVVGAAYEIINKWYKQYTTTLEQDNIARKARNSLMSEVLNSWNVAYDTVFQTLCCSPSGQPLTVIVNTLCLIIYIYTCWLDVMSQSKRELADIRGFLKHCVMFAYGDDFIMSVDPDIGEIWNNQVLQNTLRKYGVNYTGIDKKQEVKKFECLERTTFLGRKFTYVDNVPAGALDIGVINDVPNWIHKRHLADPDKVQYSMTVGLLQEFVFHGKQKFEEAHTKLREYWLSRGKPLVSCDWETLHERWRRNELKEAFPEVYYPLDM